MSCGACMNRLTPSSVASFGRSRAITSLAVAVRPSSFGLSAMKKEPVLVLVRPNELKEKWDGRRLRKEEAYAISGMSTVVLLDSLDALLQQWINDAANIYLNTNENNRKSNLVPVKD